MPDPNRYKKMSCLVCKSNMRVDRGVFGPRSSAMAMSGMKVKHDFFWCENSNKKWHEKVKDLIEERESTASYYIKKILTKEINDIINPLK